MWISNTMHFSKENYLSAIDSSYIRPGPEFTIVDLAIPADRKPLVTIKQMTAQNKEPGRLCDPRAVLEPRHA